MAQRAELAVCLWPLTPPASRALETGVGCGVFFCITDCSESARDTRGRVTPWAQRVRSRLGAVPAFPGPGLHPCSCWDDLPPCFHPQQSVSESARLGFCRSVSPSETSYSLRASKVHTAGRCQLPHRGVPAPGCDSNTPCRLWDFQTQAQGTRGGLSLAGNPPRGAKWRWQRRCRSCPASSLHTTFYIQC